MTSNPGGGRRVLVEPPGKDAYFKQRPDFGGLFLYMGKPSQRWQAAAALASSWSASWL
jgi:hypothetical protein